MEDRFRASRPWLEGQGAKSIQGERAYEIYVDRCLPVEGQERVLELKPGQQLFVKLSEDGGQVLEVAVVG